MLSVYAVVEVAQSRKLRVRNLPHWLWAVVVICAPVIGPVLWFGWGRPVANRPKRRNIGPDDDEDFLRGLR